MSKKHIVSALVFLMSLSVVPLSAKKAEPQIEKVKDVVIYSDPDFFSSFPSVVKLRNGKIIVAFRRAPDRRIFSENPGHHIDDNAYFVKVESRDAVHWSSPEVFFAHPFGGSQDPCLLYLKNGDILCEGYLWIPVRESGLSRIPTPYVSNAGTVFGGGFFVRSEDGGQTFQGPFVPSSQPNEINYSPLGGKLPAYNRGALYQGANGDIYWAVAGSTSENLGRTGVYLMVSHDNGYNWEYMSEIASDERISFNETSMYETPSGDLVAFLRSESFGDQACIARSTDGGKTFKWESMGFQGHPLQATRLPDKRVLLTYGYRHVPYGVRAKILNPECSDFKTAPEFVLRDDANNGDTGYSWSVVLDRRHALVVYYTNNDKTNVRHIEGTIIKIAK